MNETIKKLFEGVEGLDPEFAAKAMVVFEAIVKEAIEAGVAVEVTKLTENFNTKLTEAEVKLTEDLTDKMAVFLDAAVLEWAEANKVEVGNAIQVDVATKFLGQLKEMFEYNNVALPTGTDNKVVEGLQTQVAELSTKLAEATKELTESKAVAAKAEQAKILEGLVAELADTKKERVVRLAESIAFVDMEDFKQKVSYIIEAFADKPAAPAAPVVEPKDPALSEQHKDEPSKNSLIEQTLKIM